MSKEFERRKEQLKQMQNWLR